MSVYTSLCPAGIYGCAMQANEHTEELATQGLDADVMTRDHLSLIQQLDMYNEKNGWITDPVKAKECCDTFESTCDMSIEITLVNTCGVDVEHANEMTEGEGGRLKAHQGTFLMADDFTVAFVDTIGTVQQAFVAHTSKTHQDVGRVAQVIREHFKSRTPYTTALLCPPVSKTELPEIDLLHTLVGQHVGNNLHTGKATQKITVTLDKKGSSATAVTEIVMLRSMSSSETHIHLDGSLSLMYFVINAEGQPEFIMCVELPS